jgi:dihydroxyacetone kinase
MLDALLPAARALADGGSLEAAAQAAEAGAEATADRVAVKGRASYLGERGVGSADPGATSAAIVIRALASAGDGA